MQKLIALGCVLSWSSFWTFGYLALSASPQDAAQASLAAALAGAGFLVGTLTYIRLGTFLRSGSSLQLGRDLRA